MKSFLNKVLKRDGPYATASNEFFIWPNTKIKSTKEKSTQQLGLKVLSNIHNPSITAYFPSPEIATGTALIIAPGGSHRELWIEHEGYNVAQHFSGLGIASFVLKYRLGKKFGSPYSVMQHSLADMQQAIKYVRANAIEWNISPSRIGVMGFSAGGELAALAGEYFTDGTSDSNDKILQQSSCPNFQALIYSSWPKKFSPAKNSLPLFLLAGEKDKHIAKSIAEIHKRYKVAGASSELHIYPNEDHGFGIQQSNSEEIKKWPERFIKWLTAEKLI